MKDTPRPANPEDKVLGEMNSLKVYLKKALTAIMSSSAKTQPPQPKNPNAVLCRNF